MDEDLELAVPPVFDNEVLFIYIDDAASAKVQVTDDILREARITIKRLTLSDAERVSYVRHALVVDDGEAQTIAIAEHRRMTFLSDDVAGQRLANGIGLQVTTTLDLIFEWAKHRSDADVRAACQRLRKRGRYSVPRWHHLADWYRERL